MHRLIDSDTDSLDVAMPKVLPPRASSSPNRALIIRAFIIS